MTEKQQVRKELKASKANIKYKVQGIISPAKTVKKNTTRIKNRFIHNIKHYSVPTGLTIAASMIALSIFAHFNGLSRGQLNTWSAIITFTIGLFLVYKISRPLNLFRGLLLLLIIAIAIGALTIPFTREIFEFAPLF